MLVRSTPAAQAGTAPVLSVDDVTIQYRTDRHVVTAAERVSFDVHRSDRFVLLGPSGCGKSTLLKSIGGYVAPVEGEIRLAGTPVTEPGPDRVFVFQEFDQLLPWRTVRQNVVFALTNSGRCRSAREADEIALHYLDKVKLSRVADHYPHTLSGGMKQRVAIARGLAMQPEVLLMDEPFAALDALTRLQMQEELLRLWEETRVTLLFVTHSIEEAIVVGARILVLTPHPGQVRAELNAGRFGRADVGRPEFGELHDRIYGMLFGAEAPGAAGRPSVSPAGGAPAVDSDPEPAPPEASEFDRPEIEREASPPRAMDEIERKLPLWRRLWDQDWLRKATVVAAVLAAWQAYTVLGDVEPLVFPSVVDTLTALVTTALSGELLARVWTSLKVLLAGYVIGMALAGVLTAFAVTTRFGGDVLGTLTAMFNPLPAIALLPLAMLWFGLGNGSLIFVLVHSVLWAVALNSHSGFRSVSETQRMVGRNYGLGGLRLVAKVLIPSAFAAILTGLKIGWAFAWRTLIAAELVFGANSGGGGLGWFIFENSQNLYTDKVFAGLLAVMLIGVAVEYGIFRTIEKRTVQQWGMQR